VLNIVISGKFVYIADCYELVT